MLIELSRSFIELSAGIMVSDFVTEESESGYLRIDDATLAILRAVDPTFPQEARLLLEYTVSELHFQVMMLRQSIGRCFFPPSDQQNTDIFTLNFRMETTGPTLNFTPSAR